MNYNKDYRQVLKRGKWVESWTYKINPWTYKKRDFYSILIFYTAILTFSIILAVSCELMAPKIAHSEEIDLKIIANIESSNNPQAYNKRSGAIGLYQITSICLKDYNQYHLSKQIKEYELCNAQSNTIVANWYLNVRIPSLLRHHKHVDNINNRLIAYNCGISCVGKKLPLETVNYINKYNKMKG